MASFIRSSSLGLQILAASLVLGSTTEVVLADRNKWNFEADRQDLVGTITPGGRARKGLSIACIRDGKSVAGYTGRADIREHGPDEVVLYITRSYIGSQKRKVGEIAPILTWENGAEAQSIEVVRVRPENRFYTTLPREGGLLEQMTEAETFAMSGDKGKPFEIPLDGYEEALEKLRTFCSQGSGQAAAQPSAPPDTQEPAKQKDVAPTRPKERAAPAPASKPRREDRADRNRRAQPKAPTREEEEVQYADWHGPVSCKGLTDGEALLSFTRQTGGGYSGRLMVNHSQSILRGIPIFGVLGREDSDGIRFVIDRAIARAPYLRTVPEFRFDPASGRATFAEGGACTSMALSEQTADAPRRKPSIAVEEHPGSYFQAASEQEKCEAAVAWLERAVREYPDVDMTVRPSSAQTAWRHLNLLGDDDFVPLFGQPYDSMPLEARRGAGRFLRNTCNQDPFLRDRFKTWYAFEGSMIGGDWTTSGAGRFTSTASVFAVRRIREIRNAVASIDGAAPASAGNFDEQLARLIRTRDLLQENPYLLWPSEREDLTGKIDARIASLSSEAGTAAFAQQRAIQDPLARLTAITALEARLEGGLQATMAKSDIARLREELASDRRTVVAELSAPLAAAAQSAGAGLADIRALLAFKVPSELADLMSEQEKSALLSLYASAADERLKPIVDDRLSALEGLSADRKGLSASEAWIAGFDADFGAFSASPSVAAAKEFFARQRGDLLKGALPAFEAEVDAASDSAEIAEIQSAYLGWIGDASLPIFREYDFLKKMIEARTSLTDFARRPHEGRTPWQWGDEIAAFGARLLTPFAGTPGHAKAGKELRAAVVHEIRNIAETSLSDFDALAKSAPESWQGVARLNDNRETIAASSHPAAFSDYEEIIERELHRRFERLERQARQQILDFGRSHRDIPALYDLSKKTEGRFQVLGESAKAAALRAAADQRAEEIFRRDLPRYEDGLAGIAPAYDAAEELQAAAEKFDRDTGLHDGFKTYAERARDRARVMLAGLCDTAVSDAGLSADLSGQPVMVSGAPVPAREFVCDLDRLGHDVREFASPGSLAGGEDVTLKIAQREGGAFDFAVLQRVEALPGQMVLVGAEIGDALRRKPVGLEDWENYTSALMGLRPAAPAGGQQSVFATLRQSTVWIVNSRSSGTGAFIAPNLVLTNAHVVEKRDKNGNYAGLVESGYVASREFGVRPFRLIKNARRQTDSKADAAVIEILDYKSPTFLAFARDYRLDQYIASAGHPGSAGKLDARYTQTLSNVVRGVQVDRSILPSPVVVEGRINNVIVNRTTGGSDLLYTMETAGGASGSPVVNECGQMVGLHYSGSTSRVRGEGQNLVVSSVKYNAGVAHPHVEDFLNMAKIPFTKAQRACSRER